MQTPADAVAVIVAAGSGQRMGGNPKAFISLLGRPLIEWTLRAFEEAPDIGAIVLVLQQDALYRGDRLVAELGLIKVTAVCAGGATRRESVQAGLNAAPPSRWTVVHDGARPCVTHELIEKGMAQARAKGSAIAALPVEDTVKEVEAEGIVLRTPDRSRLYAVQTPQIFQTDVLRRAHAEATGASTDDASLLEALGLPVYIYAGEKTNIKVTTSDDLLFAEAVLRQRAVSETR